MLNDLELMNILAGGLQKQAAALDGTEDIIRFVDNLGIPREQIKKWLDVARSKSLQTAEEVLNYIRTQGDDAKKWADAVSTKLGNDLSKFNDYIKIVAGTARDTITDKAKGAWESAKQGLGTAADYVKGRWDAGNDAIVKTAPWQKVIKWMGDKGGDSFLHRMGRSLANKPLKWGSGALGAAGLLGTGLYAALSNGGSNDSALGQIGDATGEVFDSLGMEDIPDSYRGLLAAGAIASPVLGAAAGGISGNGMLRGAAQGLGLAGGSYAGYKGGKALADYLENSDMLSGLGSGGKDAVRLASILGGTALGGIGGTSLAGALVPKGY